MDELASSLEVPRNPSATQVLLAVGARHGLPAEAALAGSGLRQHHLDDPDVEIDAGQELTIIRNLVHHTLNRPGPATEAGRSITIGMLGVWGMALLLSRTPRDATDVAVKYGYRKFSWELLRPRIETRAAERWIHFDTADLPDDLVDFVVERDMAYSTTLISLLFGRAARYRTETTLTGARAQELAAAFPHHPFRFGSSTNAQVVEATSLDALLPRADPSAVRICERQCEDLLAHRLRRSGTAAAVRSALLRMGPTRPSLHDIAIERHVDPRTLRRQLVAEGTSFRALSDEVGRTMAIELLTAAGLTVEQVADRLGYADAASLTRAFKRWTGSTPGAVARAHPFDARPLTPA